MPSASSLHQIRLTDARKKSVLWSAFQSVRNHHHYILRAEEEKDHLDCYMHKVVKAASFKSGGMSVPMT